MVTTVALIVGAGRGHRFGSEIPKQYCDVGGQSLIRRILSGFLDHLDIDGVRAVIHPDDRAHYNRSVRGLDGLLPPVSGGATRQDSVRLGLESLGDLKPRRVLIHDAARPFVNSQLISRVIEALNDSTAAIPTLPVNDTLKRAANGWVGETVDRSGLWRAQTPQGFRYVEILAAHRTMAGRELTDDAAVAEAAGLAVAIVNGDEANVKVTTQDDLARAERSLGAIHPRTGMGFDVHRFGDGDHVMLCGVKIPHSRGLEGHSDADVGLHAVTDALLGTIGGGDIGHHFPPTDAAWRDAASEVFLDHVRKMIATAGGTITNIDVTLICEAPKVGPHRDAMRHRISEILGVEIVAVNVKATTTESLGFTGRGEGIVAQALATVIFP